jgi:hypothetical protein
MIVMPLSSKKGQGSGLFQVIWAKLYYFTSIVRCQVRGESPTLLSNHTTRCAYYPPMHSSPCNLDKDDNFRRLNGLVVTKSLTKVIGLALFEFLLLYVNFYFGQSAVLRDSNSSILVLTHLFLSFELALFTFVTQH